MLYGIDRIVQGQNITVGRNLRMQRDQSPSGAVIMHDQIVNPGDIIIRENDVVNLLYLKYFNIRRFRERDDKTNFGKTWNF